MAPLEPSWAKTAPFCAVLRAFSLGTDSFEGAGRSRAATAMNVYYYGAVVVGNLITMQISASAVS